MSSTNSPKPELSSRSEMLSPITCYVDDVAGLHLRGWAYDQTNAKSSPILHLIVDGQEVGQVACTDARPDLKHIRI